MNRGVTVSGDVVEMTSADGGIAEMGEVLASMLYQRLYCRPSAIAPIFSPDTRAVRVFVDSLSQANSGSGTWDSGWVVTAVEDDGTLVVHKHPEDLTLWASPRQFRAAGGAVGVGHVGRLSLGKELRAMLPGFYTILGDADQPDGYAEIPLDIVRFYWHLTSHAAPLWIKELHALVQHCWSCISGEGAK